MQVGAVNCLKHRDLCKLLSVGAFPTLIALNPPGQPRGTSAKPSIKNIAKSRAYEDMVDTIKREFPDAVGPAAVGDVAAAAWLLEQQEQGAAVPGRKTQETEDENQSVGVAPCILRIEDAVMSVRFFLRIELFTLGDRLSEQRLGELQ